MYVLQAIECVVNVFPTSSVLFTQVSPCLCYIHTYIHTYYPVVCIGRVVALLVTKLR